MIETISGAGFWLALEGIDAVGKSTQIPKVAELLKPEVVSPIITIPEFSNSVPGQEIQRIIERDRFFSLENGETPLASALFLLSDVVSQYEQSIAPALAEGGVVISDRGPASFIAYQTIGIEEKTSLVQKKDAYSWTKTLAQHCLTMPDLTILIQLPEKEMIKRIIERGETKPDADELEFLNRVNVLLERAAEQTSKKVITINGNKSINTVAGEIARICLENIKENMFLIPEKEIRDNFEKENIVNFAVGAAIINEEGKILLIKRIKDDFLGGYYEMPGGEVEADETFKKCLIREVKEETNLDTVSILRISEGFTYIHDEKNIRQINFIIKTKDGEVELNPKEHDQIFWASLENLEKINITKKMKTCIARILKSSANL